MLIADLGKDKGYTLAMKLINEKYMSLPNVILLDYPGQLSKLGGICPKLKAIISHYGIKTVTR